MKARVLLTAALPLVLLSSTMVDAQRGSGGGGGDRVDKVNDRAARDTARAEERAHREDQRYTEGRAKILTEAGKDPGKAREELAKLEENRSDDQAKAAEDAAKDAEDYAEDMAKALSDVADDDYEVGGSSEEMRGLAEQESPGRDAKGYPVRRREIAALDLGPDALAKVTAKGFSVISSENFPSLSATVTRLAIPDGMEPGNALALARQTQPDAAFDFVHYYSMQYAPSGAAANASAVRTTLPRKKDRLTIGMIDTGVVSHPALNAASITTRDFGHVKGSVPREHGTAVASILVSEGSSKLYVANIFRGSIERPYTSADALAQALEWMAASKVPVINISLAGPRNAILDKLIERSVGNGTVIVAAAGNGGPSAAPAYPAALKSVVAVTAVDKNSRVYRYANQGNYITIASRGVDEAAARADGTIGAFSGTSFATPHVAAWFARCLKSSRSTACAANMRKRAKDLGAPGYDKVYGHGLIQ